MASSVSRGLVGGLTFANVCSFLALVVALGTGGAYASGMVNSHHIKNETIRSVDIKDGQVQAADLGGDAVDGTKVRDDSLTGQDLGAGSVGSTELANDAVIGTKVADGSLSLADLVGIDISGHVSLSGVGNGRCTQVNFSAAGAAVGEQPLVSTGAALQEGLVIYAQRVSAAGVVNVDVCNFSGGAMTAISDLPVRIVTIG